MQMTGMRTLVPRGTNVLCQRQEEPNESGIVLPAAKTDEGYVIRAVVVDTGYEAAHTYEDEIVYFSRLDGEPVIFRGDDYYLVPEDRILAHESIED